MTSALPCTPTEQAGFQSPWVAAALDAALGAWNDAPPGRLVCHTAPIPGIAMDDLNAEALWQDRAGGAHWAARGRAAELEGEAAARFAAGDEALRSGLDLAPIAFFTADPATETPAARLSAWVPAVLARPVPGWLALTLSARRDGSSPAPGWREAIGQLLSPRPATPVIRLTGLNAAPSPEAWMERVRQASRAVAEGQLRKVVLARRLSASAQAPVDPAALAASLARLNPECCIFALPHQGGHVVAASPERLATKRGRFLACHALAGTAPRTGNEAVDARVAAGLLASPKERREHQVVVDTMAEGLRALCDTVSIPSAPRIMTLRFVQHLWTPLEGSLRPGLGLLDAVARLHPTPAVLGSPADAAARWLRAAGESRDGLYTGIAGWIDADGDGDAVVVLRSCHVREREVVLWAGAGIMAESDPAHELAETDLKLRGILELLTDP